MSDNERHGRTIAVTSGKGGVGKTCLVANLAWALAHAGRRVLVLDADLGLANLDIVLDLNPPNTLHDVLNGTCPLDDAVITGPGGIHVIAAASGTAEYARMTTELGENLPALLAELQHRYDFVMIDTGAGISDVVLYTQSLAQEVLVVATPEPTSLTDAYATIKVMSTLHERRHFLLVVNQAPSDRAASALADKLRRVVARFLRKGERSAVELTYLGGVRSDPAMTKSVCAQRLIMEAAPSSPAARGIRTLADKLGGSSHASRRAKVGNG